MGAGKSHNGEIGENKPSFDGVMGPWSCDIGVSNSRTPKAGSRHSSKPTSTPNSGRRCFGIMKGACRTTCTLLLFAALFLDAPSYTITGSSA